MKSPLPLGLSIATLTVALLWPFVFFGCVPEGTPPPTPALTGHPASGQANPLLAETNAYRAANGLPPMAWDARLQTSAGWQALDCGQTGQLSHVGLDGSWPWDRIKRAGLNYSAASENAFEAGWNPSASEVVDAWASDPPHRANLLGPYARMGSAFSRDGRGNTYWIADYASERR